MRNVLIVIVLLLAATLAPAQDAPFADARAVDTTNVLITVTISSIEGDRKTIMKSYDLVVASGSPGSKLLAGSRVPLPAGSSDEMAYQNIGFVTEASAWVLDDTNIQLMAEIEDSRVVRTEDAPPTVETRQLSVNVIVKDGVPLMLTKAKGVTDQTGMVEIEARILR